MVAVKRKGETSSTSRRSPKANARSVYEAAAAGDRASVEADLRAGANVDERGELEQTPLHIAALNGHEDMVALLLKRWREGRRSE